MRPNRIAEVRRSRPRTPGSLRPWRAWLHHLEKLWARWSNRISAKQIRCVSWAPASWHIPAIIRRMISIGLKL